MTDFRWAPVGLILAMLAPAGRPAAEAASADRRPDRTVGGRAAEAGWSFTGGEPANWTRTSGPADSSAARRPRRTSPGTIPPSPPGGGPADSGLEPVPAADRPDAVVPGPAPHSEPAPPRSPASLQYGRVPSHFIRNDGQIDQAVRYYMKGSRGTVYLTGDEVVFDFFSARGGEAGTAAPPGDGDEAGMAGGEGDRQPVSRLVFRVRFLEANPETVTEGKKELPGKVNYFVGARENWRTAIPTFEEVVYRDLYPGIELVCSFRDGNLACRGAVAPGADPGLIALRYSGVEGLEITPAGDLIARTAFGGFRTPSPRLHQEIGGERINREGAFILRDDFTVGFAVDSYDREFPLIIEF